LDDKSPPNGRDQGYVNHFQILGPHIFGTDEVGHFIYGAQIDTVSTLHRLLPNRMCLGSRSLCEFW